MHDGCNVSVVFGAYVGDDLHARKRVRVDVSPSAVWRHPPPPQATHETPLTLPLPPSLSLYAAAAVHRSAQQFSKLTLGELSLQELSVMCDLEDEAARVGHFVRIFPTEHTRYYNQFFEAQRCVVVVVVVVLVVVGEEVVEVVVEVV